MFLSHIPLAYSAPDALKIYTEHFPPYSFLENEQLVGINTDIVRATCKRSQFHCELSLWPWKRALKNASDNPDAGVYSISKTPDREEHYQWVGPLVSSNACFYKLAHREDINVQSKDSLSEYTIGIARGDVYQRLLIEWGLEEGKHFLTYSNKHDDLQTFKAGKLDLIIGSSLTLEHQLAKVDLRPTDIEPVLRIQDSRIKGNFLALNPSVDEQVVSAMQQALDALKDEGVIDSIATNYIKNEAQTELPNSSLHRACLSGAVNY